MFNGLIREIAKVRHFSGDVLDLEAKMTPKLGDSIAVNGACLSVTNLHQNGFEVELSARSQSILALSSYKKLVHIESALIYGSTIDGHLLSGHIDGVGEIASIKKYKNQYEFAIKAPKHILQNCIKRGSIAVNGVSLTIADVNNDSFLLIIIPLTMQTTLFSHYKVRDLVNIETDLMVKNMHALLEKMLNKNASLSWEQCDEQVFSY
ncbi:MAG: riboflavin synthase [Helicobacter sp.]|nr:riboflavin synthase [Helicobacter sp.]